ncbi:MAG: hypothetical protein LBS95_01535 [Mycoplasmataceae bacterium]|nr:hypothetical protein [Mycoplasmataceae bacterium]
MSFISSKERYKESKRIFSGNGFKKIWLLVTLILTIVYVAYIGLSLAVTLHYANVADIPKWIEWFYLSAGNNSLVSLIVTCVVAFMIIISLILVFTFRSSKKVANDISSLMSSAIPGKKKNNVTHADEYKNRVIVTKKKK